MFGSIRSVCATYVSALDLLCRTTANPLSIRNCIHTLPDAKPIRALYLPYTATQIAALRSTISAWLRLAIFEAMSGAERDQRIWFIVDELDALGAIDGLKDALARLRKFGGRCVLGFQSIAQVSSTYGSGEAQTIVENCGNTLILRCSASEQGGTARFASRLIGDREVIRPQISYSRRPGEWRSGRNRAEQHVIEAAVLPSEIEQLPDLAGYLKLASAAAWRNVRLTSS
jgi:type IV secretory pathway TraG/TraD family ATPase VirD4